jgi:alpha-beta hydrolase superfamily lysophospholipase
VQPEPVYGVLHSPEEQARTRLAALILPTFGWDSDCSYRARRAWATKLAESGLIVARIDFPGTENSVGSPLARGRVQSWVDATATAARWLRERSDCDRLVAIGVGLGGLIAYQAVCEAAPIDDLVLWATRASGRAYLRELRAYATATSDENIDTADAVRADGAIGIGGHIMSAETGESLRAMKIAGVPLPHARLRRVLLLGRDAHGIDSKLRDHLADSGAMLTALESDDYHELMALPELRLMPTKTIAASIDWIHDPSAAHIDPIPHATEPSSANVAGAVDFEFDGAPLRERISELHTPEGRLVGIISEPAAAERAPYCLVVVNAGELRHTGPNRIFVEMARRAAAMGVPMARFDLPGIGDSDGNPVRTFERTVENDADSLAVLEQLNDHLQRLGVADRFVPVGLCLGGYLAMHTALTDERSVGAICINPPTFRWTSVQQNTLRRGLAAVAPEAMTPAGGKHVPQLLEPLAAWAERTLRSVNLRARRQLAHSRILWRLTHHRGIVDACATLDQFAGGHVRLLLLLSEDETLLRLLEQPKLAAKLRRCSNIEVERLPTHDHVLRSLWSQEKALERVGVALAELLPPRLLPPSEHHTMAARFGGTEIGLDAAEQSERA